MTTTNLSPAYAITVRIECPHQPGWIARVAEVIGHQGAVIEAIDLVEIRRGRSIRDYTMECASPEHAQGVIDALRQLDGLTLHSYSDKTMLLHLGGKLAVTSRVPLKTRADLSMAYTPGVARVCEAIAADSDSSFNLTIRKNCIAVVSDGSAVLGLGNIGPEAAMPVMEGKAILFKEFGGVDAFPLCIATQDPQKIIEFCQAIEPTFGGINLEDISSPRCFEIERELKQRLDIPVFHDDQHGTAVVALAALINAFKITGREPKQVRLVISGAGAAGAACAKMLQQFGIEDIVVCDSRGAIHSDRNLGDNPVKLWLAKHTNPKAREGSLKEVLQGADVFLGVSAPGVIDRQDVESMNRDPIVFAMANPTPEILPHEISDVAAVIATGRADYPNQVNNVLAFPGIFRGALQARARDINEEMKLAAAHAIAGLVGDNEMSPDYVIPSPFNRKVARTVAKAVAQAARRSGVVRRTRSQARKASLR